MYIFLSLNNVSEVLTLKRFELGKIQNIFWLLRVEFTIKLFYCNFQKLRENDLPLITSWMRSHLPIFNNNDPYVHLEGKGTKKENKVHKFLFSLQTGLHLSCLLWSNGFCNSDRFLTCFIIYLIFDTKIGYEPVMPPIWIANTR